MYWLEFLSPFPLRHCSPRPLTYNTYLPANPFRLKYLLSPTFPFICLSKRMEPGEKEESEKKIKQKQTTKRKSKICSTTQDNRDGTYNNWWPSQKEICINIFYRNGAMPPLPFPFPRLNGLLGIDKLFENSQNKLQNQNSLELPHPSWFLTLLARQPERSVYSHKNLSPLLSMTVLKTNHHHHHNHRASARMRRLDRRMSSRNILHQIQRKMLKSELLWDVACKVSADIIYWHSIKSE